METINLTKEGRIAIVEISRPKALNALNKQVFDELAQVLAELKSDDETGALIITGSGEKAFVAGADIKELATLDALTARTLSSRGQGVFRTIETFPKPVIAAVNGFALGGGCELALSCHMRVASTSARMGLPEVGLGLIPGYGGTQRLARLIGKGVAMELTLTGGMIKADRALAVGLVNHVVEPTELLDKCREIAGAILEKAPLAVRFALEAITHGLDLAEEEGERMEANLFGLAAGTQDATEGLNAFIEKRKAQFKGC